MKEGFSKAQLTIFNALGAVVLTERIELEDENQIMVNVSLFEPGIYYLQFQVDNNLYEMKKLIIE